MSSNKVKLTTEALIKEAEEFCKSMSKIKHKNIAGVTDGKAIGTYIEHEFKGVITSKYTATIGSSASGIDFPDPEVNTDMKTTFITQPQSSCPFKDARQKIFGLGYNLLLFVYQKDDSKKHNLEFLHARFIDKTRTADYQTTRGLNEIIERNGNIDDIKAFLTDRNLPVDDILLESIAQEILENPPLIGYLTISNVLQWRLQYSGVIRIAGKS
ncbi:MAG: restriction endonuclease [bacterium]